MKKLRLLNLSSNKFSYKNEDEYNEIKNYFIHKWLVNNDSIKTLVLHSCQIDFRLIELFIDKLNNLNELHLSSNEYEKVSFSDNFSKSSVKYLYFNRNNLSDWNEVAKLGKCFPNLEYLSIFENNLTDFSDVDDQSTHIQNCFLNLKTLVINKLNINNWKTIDKLKEFKQLNNVKIQNIPLLANYSEEEKYFMLVSHLGPQIETLNGSKIKSEERETCERKFIRYYMDKNLDENKPHDIINQLESKHGKLDRLAHVDLDEAKKRRVQCKIKFGDKHTYEKIDIRQTVGDLKKKLEQFVGHSSSKFRIYHIDMEACSQLIYGPDELKIPTRRLHTLNIRDGDEFEIDLKKN